MCQSIHKQDLRATTWSILIFFLRHLVIWSSSCLNHQQPLFPTDCFIWRVVQLMGGKATAAKNLVNLFGWIWIIKSESQMILYQTFSWVPWGWVKTGMRGEWDWCKKWKFWFHCCGKNPLNEGHTQHKFREGSLYFRDKFTFKFTFSLQICFVFILFYFIRGWGRVVPHLG